MIDKYISKYFIFFKRVSTSIIESGQQIPTSWMAATEASTQALAEVMAIPQSYSNAQPHPFRVEMGNNGQQYMIVDSKYLTQCTEGMNS